MTSRFPYPLEKGDKLRLYYQIKYFSQRHELVLCSLVDEEVSKEAYEKVNQYCEKIYLLQTSKVNRWRQLALSFANGMPLNVAYFFEPNLKRKVADILKKEIPDHIFCQLIRVAEYVRDADFAKSIDYMDAFSVSTERWAKKAPFLTRYLWRMEAKKLTRYEQSVYADFDHHYIISGQDRSLMQLPVSNSIGIVRNGVDFDFFQPKAEVEKTYDGVFVGNMGYRPNVDAAVFLVREVMPLIWDKSPDFRLLLAGARPAKEVQALASERVIISGWVDDIRDAYACASVFIAPLFLGAGLQNKILEAMCMQIPCITTPLVNNAIGAHPDKEILLAETKEQFATFTLDLLKIRKKLKTFAEVHPPLYGKTLVGKLLLIK